MEASAVQAERFSHPAGSEVSVTAAGLLVRVPGSGGLVLDDELMQIWRWAPGRSEPELASLSLFADRTMLSAELLALRKAGLLLPPLPEERPEPALPPAPLPPVSAVIVTRNGRRHLEECLPSLRRQSYAALEVVVVDNESTDGTADYLRTEYPEVRFVAQPGKPNFARACNLGIAAATGAYVLLVNNDTVLDERCVAEMVAAAAAAPDAAAVGGMLRLYGNRPFVNGLGTYVPPNRLGYDLGIGSLDVGQFDGIRELPLVCFGAALLSRAAIEQVGPLDEGYEFYYEDADWSYRARARGYRLAAAPRALIYHKFSASTGEVAAAFKLRMALRNRLGFALRNLPPRELCSYAAGYLAEDAGTLLAAFSRGELRQRAGVVLSAWGQAIRSLPANWRVRRGRWRGVLRHPVSQWALAAQFPPPELQGQYPRLTAPLVHGRYAHWLLGSARVGGAPGGTRRVLVISPDTVDKKMGGVGMRYWELARVLAGSADVTLAAPGPSSLQPEGFRLVQYRQGAEATLRPLVAAAETVLLSGFAIHHHPFLRTVPQNLVVDLYDPTVLENLERFAGRPLAEQMGLHAMHVRTYNDLFQLGDFFICATEKQRDYWLGGLTSANRVNPESYAADPALRRLIDVVPFGLPDEPLPAAARSLKGQRPGIGANDKVILWGGGVWDWLDPLTAIRAMPLVTKQVPEARLFFMGIRHPNPAVPPSRMAETARREAEALGIVGKSVFFNSWAAYEERLGYLADADAGISLHSDHVETRFAIRTRLMDYIWAGLPMVVNGGDTMGELAAERGLARVVPPGDVEATAAALVEVLTSPPDPGKFDALRRQFAWTQVAGPLVRYVEQPWRNGPVRGAAQATAQVATSGIGGGSLARKAAKSLATRGVRGLVQDAREYIRWRMA